MTRRILAAAAVAALSFSAAGALADVRIAGDMYSLTGPTGSINPGAFTNDFFLDDLESLPLGPFSGGVTSSVGVFYNTFDSRELMQNARDLDPGDGISFE